jgi:hypothetical protein
MFCHRLLRSITDTRTVADGTDNTMIGWPGGHGLCDAAPVGPAGRTIHTAAGQRLTGTPPARRDRIGRPRRVAGTLT